MKNKQRKTADYKEPLFIRCPDLPLYISAASAVASVISLVVAMLKLLS